MKNRLTRRHEGTKNTESARIALSVLVVMAALALAVLAGKSPAYAQTGSVTKAVMVGTNGMVATPSNFWQTNAPGIASAVSTNFAPITGATNYTPAAHASATNNPHAVTKSQVGLTNVENTALSTWTGSTNLLSGIGVPEGSTIAGLYDGTMGSVAYALDADNATHANSASSANDADTLDGNHASAFEPKGAYAVIYIPLPAGSQWTDFKLKVATDNFTSGQMVFFYHSADPTKVVSASQVWTNRPDVYFTDSGKTGTPNQRGWIKQNTTQSIFAMLTDANSEVGGFLVIIKDDLSADRDHLVFSYWLLDASTGDTDPSNREVWRPVWPQQWVNTFSLTQ